jgi:BASS family bile acid:Na+ symporter
MDLVINLFLPLCLVVIMFSLGLGLEVTDFRRVIEQPKAFALGAVLQLLLVPVVAYGIVIGFRLPRDLALGVMILAFCPGGFTSNILTKLSRGDVALSISLTGVISLISIFTIPLLVKLAVGHFLALGAPPVDVATLGFGLFLLTGVPAAIGIGVKHYAHAFARRIDRPVANMSTLLFCVVVVFAVATNWALFVENVFILGPSLLALNVLLLAAGLGVARLFSLDSAEATAISIETGIQSAAIAITVGSLIAGDASALPPYILPAGVYGVLMYLVSVPFVLWRRSGGLATPRPRVPGG